MKTDLFTITRSLLKPVLYFCMKRSLKVQDIISALKIEAVSLATKELQDRDEPVSVSRLSAMTGLQRKEIASILKYPEHSATAPHETNIIARVVGQWMYDKRFSRKDGKPRALTTEGIESDFAKLVRAVSSDLNHHTILFELERLGYVKREEGAVKLVSTSHGDRSDVMAIISEAGKDIEDLYRAVEANVLVPEDQVHLHARTAFDNIPREELPSLRRWLLRAGSIFHYRISQYLAKFDRDITQKKSSGDTLDRGRIVVGTFSFTEEFIQKEPVAPSKRKK